MITIASTSVKEPIPMLALSNAILASDRAAYVTGTVTPVDGGLTHGLL